VGEVGAVARAVDGASPGSSRVPPPHAEIRGATIPHSAAAETAQTKSRRLTCASFQRWQIQPLDGLRQSPRDLQSARLGLLAELCQ